MNKRILFNKKNSINKIAFYWDFNNNNNDINSIGKLIIGAYPYHLNKKYNKKNLLVNNICLEKKYSHKWNLNSIHVKNKKIEDEINIIFRPNFGGFLTNEIMKIF